MTATEVMQRREEQLRTLGPMLGRQNHEFLKPLVERVFGIMSRKKLFAPAPAIIQDSDLEVRYTSQIARVQETGDADNLTRVLGIIGPLAQANPTMLDNFDNDFIVRELVNKFGLPAGYLKSERVVAAKRTAEAEAVQQEQQINQANAELDAIGKLGTLGG